MLIKAEQKFIRTSPKKLRYVAQSIKGVKKPGLAVSYLEMIQNLGSEALIKVLKQAIGNAKNTFGLTEGDLLIRELLINEGPSYKRVRARAKGMVKPILKQTSHVRVVLENVEKKKVQKVQEVQEVQKGFEEKKGNKVKIQKVKVKTASRKLKAK